MIQFRDRSVRRASERLDRDLAELHHARAPLQREVTFLEEAVVGLGGLRAVEREHEVALIGGDLHRVPLAGGLERGIGLGEIHDPAGAVGRIRAGVKDVELVAVARADLLRVLAAHEDAAVGLLIGPELDVDHVILVRVLGHQMAATAGLAIGTRRRSRLVGDERAALDPPVGGADLVPAIHGAAIEELGPAGAGLGEGALTERGSAGKRERRSNDGQAFHDFLPKVQVASRWSWLLAGSSTRNISRRGCTGKAYPGMRRCGVSGRSYTITYAVQRP